MVDVHHMVTFHQIKNYKYGGHTLFLKVFLWWMATIKNMTMVEIHHIFCDSYKVNYCPILREKGMVSIALLQKNTTTQYHKEPVNLIYS